MPDLSRGASELDTRLAEIDRKLRAIQVDLDPGREPAPSREPSETQHEPPAQGDSQTPEGPVAQGDSQTPEGPVAQGDSEPQEAAAAQGDSEAPPAKQPRGRSGPLAALLQRSSRHPPPPEETTTPRERGAPGVSDPVNPPANPPESGMVPPEMHAKLLSAMRDLLDAYGWTLRQLPGAVDPARGGETQPVALSVGPFVDTAAVRAFEHELLRIPGVSEVVLRGYEGEDRAMFDVQLSEPNA